MSLPMLKDWPGWPLGPVDYGAIVAPGGYRCMKCAATDVRLWRDYMCTADAITLTCFVCTLSLRDRKRGDDPYGINRPYTPESSEIDGQVAAVPTEDGDTFWGYSSVPTAAIAWWRGLRPEPGVSWSLEDSLAVRVDVWKTNHDALLKLRGYDDKLMHAWIDRAESLEVLLKQHGVPFDENWRPRR